MTSLLSHLCGQRIQCYNSLGIRLVGDCKAFVALSFLDQEEQKESWVLLSAYSVTHTSQT